MPNHFHAAASTILASADVVSVSMWGLSIAADIVMSIILYRVSATTKRLERIEDRYDGQIKDLNAELHSTATKLIDERFRAFTHELNNHVNGFTLALDAMKQRLEDGDGRFQSLAQRDENLQQLMAGKVEQIKDFLRDNCADKEDLTRHQTSVSDRFDKLGAQITTLGQQVAVLADRAGARRAHDRT